MVNSLDANARPAVVTYAAAAVGCSTDAVTGVTRFEEGNRHAVYRVSYTADNGVADDVVVRVSFSGTDTDRAQATFEAAVLTKIGGVAGPVLVDFQNESPWFPTPVMCLQFVPGRQQELASVEPAQIHDLGAIVAWLHEQDIEGMGEELPSRTVIRRYAEARLRSIRSTMHWVRDPLPAAVKARVHSAAHTLQTAWPRRRRSEAFTSSEHLALLHGDIGPGNVLWSPEPMLIDWEYARVGDPADEIAYVFDQNGLSAAQRETFWHGYRDGLQRRNYQHIIDRVTWWEPLTLLGSTLWWVQRYVRRTDADAAGTTDLEAPREAGYYLDQVMTRVDRLDRQLAAAP